MGNGTDNLPAQGTVLRMLNDPALKRQIALAIPKHMTVDRLLRVAMTSIRTNPKLMDCSIKSLMACIMGCAQLGLEPEPFLGQAYLVPFKDKAGHLHAQLIPGYRGYITLARRSGEVQSVSAQAVYFKDEFRIQYGLNEALDHVPAYGDRGEFRGAYVVFRYKDGSHSFDFMTKDRIDAVRARSKAKDSGPWVTDYDEMAVKTVIRHHVKLAPLSIEMGRAAALEERAMIGEDQSSLIFDGEEVQGNELPLAEGTETGGNEGETVNDKFNALIERAKLKKEELDYLPEFVKICAEAAKKSEDEIKLMAVAEQGKYINLLRRSLAAKKAEAQAKADKKPQGKKAEKEKEPEPSQGTAPETVNPETGEVIPGPFPEDDRPDSFMIDCPNEGDGGKMALGYCRTNCLKREGCPAL